HRFFHWALEFPEVFENGGFSCVLGNPPWERIKLQEKEFFADKDEAIATAKNSAARKKLIAKLPQTHPQLAQAWEDAKHFADAQGKFVRESRRFPLTATGDINTYAIFAETVRKLIAGNGYAGVIVPTGIATDSTTQAFFGDLVKTKELATLFDFENRKKLFPEVDSRMKFVLLGLSKQKNERKEFAFFLTEANQINDKTRVFQLSSQDIKLMNPNTLTCPVFRTRTDAELTKKIYQRVPVLENEQTGENPWGISFMTMFHMSNDSNLFFDEPWENRLLLYEAKMFWHFDHRYATYQGDKTENSTLEQKQNPDYSVTPRYWVSCTEVENRLAGKWDKKWLLGWRDICRSTDERTFISSVVSYAGCGDTILLMLPKVDNLFLPCLAGNLNTLVFDFVTRQKIGGTHLKYFTVRQLPVIPPETYTPEDVKYISSRVLELVYTSYDLKPFAQDMGYEGEPFIWNETRRAVLRAELDAYYAKLYGLTRDELRYILDPADVYGDDFPSETFRVLKNNDVKKYGEYRTQRLVLAAFDRL
ncbi:restriction endonuclease, partial [Geitlerinema sp. P-1104]|nr:restriction endonuclease [Geitlerinema sp. P-1104]